MTPRHSLLALAVALPLAGCPLDSRVELGRDTVTSDAGDGETAGTADTGTHGGTTPDARMTGQNGGSEDAAASAPAILRIGVSAGKFQGVKAAATPIGSRSTIWREPGARPGMMRP